MERGISSDGRRELIQAIAKRYRRAERTEKGLILDEFVKLTNYHRKHAVRLLSRDRPSVPISVRSSRRIYDEAVRQALIVLWEAADRICGKRLRVVIPEFVDSLERHGHLHFDPELRNKLLSVSAATIDRILSPIRMEAHGKAKRRRRNKSYAMREVPIRTFADWDEPMPGHFETDLVAHNGGSTAGSCVHSLVLTDICSGWTECLALVAREQSLVVEALKVVQTVLPIPLLGIDTDNDSAFMNETVIEYCKAPPVSG